MAVFNGERHLSEQLRSILDQLAINDEVIIVDDCSHDNSVDLIRRMMDKRINLLTNNMNVGPVASFERALSLAGGQYIFLSDQDDIWMPNKVEVICNIFKSTNSLVVVSDARVVDIERNTMFESFFSWRGSRSGFWRNLYRNSFVGCCMAIRFDAKALFLPFPKGIHMHDEWIGLCSSVAGRVSFVQEKLIDYRRHENNATQLTHGSTMFMIAKRLNFLHHVLLRLPRILYWRLKRTV